MCMKLPDVIEEVVRNAEGVKVPHDTVLEELLQMAGAEGGSGEMDELGSGAENARMAMAVYMLGFGTYQGFRG